MCCINIKLWQVVVCLISYFFNPMSYSSKSNEELRVQGPCTLKGVVVLGRRRSGPKARTVVWDAQLFVGSPICPSVCGILVFYNAAGHQYPAEPCYFHVESSVSI